MSPVSDVKGISIFDLLNNSFVLDLETTIFYAIILFVHHCRLLYVAACSLIWVNVVLLTAPSSSTFFYILLILIPPPPDSSCCPER